MTDEQEWKKLPLEEKLIHAQWKARVEAYEEAAKLFQIQDSDKSPEFLKYVGLLKKMVTDTNAIAQEKALDVVFIFVENAAVATKAVGEVAPALVNKCLGAARQKTKEKAIEILLMFVEIEKHETVQEELLKGMAAKQPKVVIGSVQSMREALRLFGPKVISLKPLVKEFPRLLEDRDKIVREETKLLVIELYRWIGQALKSHLTNLKPVQQAEFETEFSVLAESGARAPVPERYLRSQQAKMSKLGSNNDNLALSNGDSTASGSSISRSETTAVIDAFDLASEVDILSKISADWYEKIEQKKWQDRREALEHVEKLSDVVKLDPAGDYADLLRALIKVVAKDTNVILVALAAKCMTQIARGLRKKFQPFAIQSLKTILEKFKEKKPNVVATLRDAADSITAYITLESASEEVVAALDNKNPCIKTETAKVLVRWIARLTLAALPKKLLKILVTSLVKNCAESQPEVRDASFEALGTAMYVVTEKNIMPFMGDDMDALKMAKVKEYYDKLVGAASSGSGVANAGAGANLAVVAGERGAPAKTGGTGLKLNVVRPTSAAAATSNVKTAKTSSVNAKGSGKPATSSGGTKTAASAAAAKSKKSGGTVNEVPTESTLADDAVEEKAENLFGKECLDGLSSAAWKERLAAMESVHKKVKDLIGEDLPCQVVLRLTAVRKPGLKDNNFQVLKSKLELIAYLAINGRFTRVTAEFCLGEVFDKLGDPKNSDVAKNALTAMAEACSLEYIGLQLARQIFQMKNPKTQTESLNWLTSALFEFGLQIPPKELLKHARLGFAATNPQVRSAAIALVVRLFLFLGDVLRQLISDEKPALLALIDQELDKVRGQRPPPPTRGLRNRGAATANEDDAEDAAAELGGGEVDDLAERQDIGEKITDELLGKLSDKNWKIRKEGLDCLQSILTAAKFITGNIGELPVALRARLSDSNKPLCTSAINICENLANALGQNCRTHVKQIVPGVLLCLADVKSGLRQAALACLNAWTNHCGLALLAESELFPEALAKDSPLLRQELIGWLSERLQALKTPRQRRLPPEFREVLTFLYAALEDRNADLRSRAQEAILPFTSVLGFEIMVKACNKLPALSKDKIRPFLDKAREQLLQSQAAAVVNPSSAITAVQQTHDQDIGHVVSVDFDAPDDEDRKKVASPKHVDMGAEKSAVTSAAAVAVKKGPAQTKRSAAMATTTKPKKEEETVEPVRAVLLPGNKPKEGRMNDEKKRKVLRWDFSIAPPQKEHREQLAMQLQAAGVAADLTGMMLHQDFKQHIRAVESLQEFLLQGGPSAETSADNLDLVLKWMALRFFETNPAMHMRGLKYLLDLFSALHEIGYHLLEFEAASFLPYLIIMVGDKKDSIRKDVRDLFKLLCHVYPASRLFCYLLEGLKSKNAKQRAECLEEMGYLVGAFGVNVCQPSPQQAMKLIGTQIADRDATVRNAALTSIVIAYDIVGEPLLKWIEPLKDKERGMLEERIRRTAKRTDTAEPLSVDVSASQATNRSLPNTGRPRSSPPQKQLPSNDRLVASAASNTHQLQQHAAGSNSTPREDGPFKLEIDDMENSRYDAPSLVPLEDELTDLYRPIDMPVTKTRSMPGLRGSVDASSAITLVLTQITASDLHVAIQALHQIDEVLSTTDSCQLLTPHVDQFILMAVTQMRNATGQHLDANFPEEATLITRLLRCLLGSLCSLMSLPPLAREASRDRLRDLLESLLQLMLNEFVSRQLPEGNQVVRSVNLLCMRILDHAERTRVICALVRLLHECVEQERLNSDFTKMVMRCLWRLTKRLNATLHDYQVGPVLQECHHFLRAFPTASWPSRQTDIPLATVKTLLHTLCGLKGDAILDSLRDVRDLHQSELDSYLRRSLANNLISRQSTSSSISLPSASSIVPPLSNSSSTGRKRISKTAAHDKLSLIFRKIGSKENTREGLNELYDFRLQYPEADAEVKPYLSKSSEFFQRHIEAGLEKVRRERELAQQNGALVQGNNSAVPTPLPSNSQVSHSHSSQMAMGRRAGSLSTLQFGAGGAAPGGPSGGPVDLQTMKATLMALRSNFGLDQHVAQSELFASSNNGSAALPVNRLGGSTSVLTDSALDLDIKLNAPQSTSASNGAAAGSGLLNESKNATTMSRDDLLALKRRLERIKNSQQ